LGGWGFIDGIAGVRAALKVTAFPSLSGGGTLWDLKLKTTKKKIEFLLLRYDYLIYTFIFLI